MSLEKNIERIADALDAIAKAAGARMPAEGNNTTLPLTGQHAAQQMPGMPPFPERGMLQFFLPDHDPLVGYRPAAPDAADAPCIPTGRRRDALAGDR